MNSARSVRNLVILIAFPVSVWLAIAPPAGLDAMQGQTAGVVLVTLVLWSTGIVPPFLVSLIFFALVLIAGIATPDLVFGGFSSAAVWLIVSGAVIGSAIGTSGLGKRLAANLAPLLAGSYARLLIGLTLAGMALAFVMPSSIGRAVVLFPVGLALADRAGFAKGSKGRIGVAVTLAAACNMPGFAILPSNIPNMILSGAAETIHDVSFGYTQYLALHFPVLGILKSAVAVALALVLFPDRVREASAPATAGEEVLADRATQGRVAAILLATLALWMTDSLHGINPAWIGMAAAVVLMLPRIGAVDPKSFNGSVDFGSVLFVAAALALGALVNVTGLGTILGEELTRVLPLAPGHDFINFVSLSVMSAATGLVTTVAGVPTVLTPLASGLAESSGFSVPAVLMIQVIGFSTAVFPYQVAPLIVAMQLSGEKLGSVLRLTLPLALVTLFALVPVDFLWWKLLGWI
ncbi:SLC13 family permease [Oricola sp.]|uniref:SLC13 family permease n=1 Tax=Oricola sp. TaxID=1979950 RepID=UPI0025E78AE1|nr:SLC13 family permease [Oricola sp.]MCI5073437.1 anion permease [Oricola sp.]